MKKRILLIESADNFSIGFTEKLGHLADVTRVRHVNRQGDHFVYIDDDGEAVPLNPSDFGLIILSCDLSGEMFKSHAVTGPELLLNWQADEHVTRLVFLRTLDDIQEGKCRQTIIDHDISGEIRFYPKNVPGTINLIRDVMRWAETP